jgi:hypothetical protein
MENDHQYYYCITIRVFCQEKNTGQEKYEWEICPTVRQADPDRMQRTPAAGRALIKKVKYDHR